MLLFAYGSNMAADEMAAFAPRARFVGPARLPDHRLELRRRSRRWGGGAADLVEQDRDEVWGALYELPDDALELLDRKEGAGLAYRRREVKVELDGERHAAVTYEVISKEPEQVPPTSEYADLLLRAAAHRGLPNAYLETLKERLATRVSSA